MKRSTVPVLIFMFFLFPNLTVGARGWWVHAYDDAEGLRIGGMEYAVSQGTLPKPVLLSPSGTISTASPTYTWGAVPSATWYVLWVDDSISQPKIIEEYTASDAGCGAGTGTCSITPDVVLAPGTGQWWVRANNDDDSSWSDGMMFYRQAGSSPGKATLISPSGNISTANPAYTWNAVASSTWYLLSVTDSKTQEKVWYEAADAGCGSGTGSCSVTPDFSLDAGSYQWRIQTYSDYGGEEVYGPWSDAMSFTVSVGGPPGKAILVSPSGNIATATPTYTWNAVPTTTWYLLCASDSKTQEKINQWYKAADVGCSSGTGTCSYTPSTALAAGAGEWWIQTWNEYGVGPWSDAMSFTVSVGGPPGKAILVSPSGNIATATPTYTWNAVPTTTWYLLSASDSKTQGKINQWYKAADVGCSSGTGTCSYTPSTALAAGASQWWIQTWNEYGVGPWSDAMSFTVSIGVPPGKATLISPSGTITTTAPTYTWNAASTATGYILLVNDSQSQGKINQSLKASDVGCSSGTGSCSYKPSTAANGACQWWVQAYNDSGSGPWSDAMTFTVSVGVPPGKATLISPSGTITTTTPTYTWNAAATATGYWLYVNDSQRQGKINQSLKASDVGCSSGTGACSYTPATALIGGACRWWIQAYNDYGSGPLSDRMDFTVAGEFVGPYKIEFATVLDGEFRMGSNNGTSEEQPIHRVIIGKSFQLGKYEITQGQWKAVMGSNPSGVTGNDNLPVDAVSWDDAQAFIAKLNALNDGYRYRLPTEAEWEYACRAGTTGDYGGTGNLDEMGWYYYNSGGKTHIVGTKKANAWGLYDMHGNVYEWVQDWFSSGYYSSSPIIDPPGPTSGSTRVGRGGSWFNGAADCRSACRVNNSPGVRANLQGFRLLRAAVTSGTYEIEFVTVAAGEFQMGSNNGVSNEQPVHRVIISKPFQLGKYEITQGQWKAVMGSNPSGFTGNDNFPVEMVSWDDAQAFIAKLNALNDGYRYRLPTEAEWEYACRAGTTGDYGGTGNLDEMGWYGNNSGDKTHMVGTKKANAWGLYDMHGNVYEWVQDWYSFGYYSSSPLTDPPGPTSGSYRIFRGGGWLNYADICRSAFRGYYWPSSTGYNLGFRLLRTAQ